MRNSNKNIVLIMLMFLFCISVGYAAINRMLNITGSSEILKNTWDIYFENVQVVNGSVDATLPVIDAATKSTVNFNVVLNLPGDFYEFTVDVVNDGTIDAMIESITKTLELTEEQKKYMNYKLEYQNGEEINSKQLVEAGEFVRLKVRVEYRKDLTELDLPTTTQTLNLGFTLNYVQADYSGSLISVKDNGIKKTLMTFTIDGKTYYAEQNSLWSTWKEIPEYNVDGFEYNDTGELTIDNGCSAIYDPTYSIYINNDDEITENGVYELRDIPC